MGTLGSIWGVAGVLAVIAFAVLRLGLRAQNIFSYDLMWHQWAVLLLGSAILLYAKSFRVFRRRIAPRIAARAADIKKHPTTIKVIFAPFYCMGYFGSTRVAGLRMISVTLAMVVLILVVRYLPEPWRAILDFGIAVALAAGFFFILAESLRHQPRG
jgi:hypothetical protein